MISYSPIIATELLGGSTDLVMQCVLKSSHQEAASDAATESMIALFYDKYLINLF